MIPTRGKPPHQIRRVVDMDIMQLKILTRGDVKNAVGVLLGELGQRVQLLGGNATERDFDALHARGVPERVGPLRHVGQEVELLGSDAVVPMPVIVALAIDSAAKTGFGKDLFVHFAGAPKRHLRLENVDFFGDLRIHSIGQFFFPGGHQTFLIISKV